MFLDRRCAGDPDLRREIDALLQCHDAPGLLDKGPRSVIASTAQASLTLGSCLGAWRIDAFVGRGGMGEVYASTRAASDFEQRGALKLLRFEAVAQWDRFHVERRILAKLEHPGIARLLDGGTSADGRPFTVMEFVQGRSLTEYCSAQSATLQQRLGLFTQICDAVAFAHRNLVVHRDLKPDNILVNAQGEVKLLDFGIAKLLDAVASIRDTENTVAPFTPDYAAPEQLSGQPVTTATDIYALGVVLFELLTGQLPLRRRGLPSTQALSLLLDRDAPAPSRIALASGAAPLPARQLIGDLDAIVAKCLRKEAAHRYETVLALKDDLERHLRNEPVQARSGNRIYIARRFVQRHWLFIAGIFALLLGLGGATLYANSARLRTEQALQRADAVREFVIDLFQQNDPDAGNGREMSARELVDLGARRVESGFGDDLDTRIELLGVSGNLYRSLGEQQRGAELLGLRLDQATLAYAPEDPRLIEAQLDMARAHISTEHFEVAQTLLDQAFRNAAPSRSRLQELRVSILLEQGRLESERDHLDQAISWTQRAIELQSGLPEIETEARAKALANLGIYIFRAGRIAEAEQPLRSALALLDRSAQTSVSTLLEVREGLGRVLTSLGRYEEALPMLRTNAESARQLLGDRHPSLANALHQLASATRQSGDPASAVAPFRESLLVYEQRYGRNHSYVATALTGLGQSLSATNQHQQAVEALTRAHEIYLTTLGPQHSYTAISIIALADTRLAAGDYSAAEAGYRAALEIYAGIGDGQHVYAEAARLGLGKALSGARRCAEAEAPLQLALARFVKEFGADDRRAIDSSALLAHCLLQLGRRDEARTLIAESERALQDSKRDVRRQRARIESARREWEDGRALAPQAQ